MNNSPSTCHNLPLISPIDSSVILLTDRYSAAQAYHRKDARSAKALSLRGQAENALMREAHRRAAQILYEDANKDAANQREIFIDLHGIYALSH
jgi:hypothetical protein